MTKLKSPKQKGDRYERALASHFNNTLFGGADRVFRAPLSGGGRSLHGGGSADLTGTPDLWVEAKAAERLAPYEAMAQAERGIAASGAPCRPIVINRRKRMAVGQSLAIMRLDDFLKIYAGYLKSQGHQLGTDEDL